jgi:hypothetical protein
MAYKKGQSGNPLGRIITERPFADALRMEIAAAGGDFKQLREIAKNLIRLCTVKSRHALPAIVALADRLDGRPAQTSSVTVTKHDASDWTREELEGLIRNAIASGAGTIAAQDGEREPDSVH